MKVYKIKGKQKVFINFMCTLSVVLGVIMTILLPTSTDSSVKYWVSAFVMIIFGIGGAYTFNKIVIIINDIKIKIHMPWKKDKIFFWNEVEELYSHYILFPEFIGIITLKPKINLGKKPFEIAIGGMPLDLLKDIILHLPPETKIELYTYLQRKLEDKQTWLFKKQEFHTTYASYWQSKFRKQSEEHHT